MLGDLVLDELLDGALQRARAVLEVRALLDEHVLGRGADLEADLLLREARADVAQEDVDDLRELFATERMEDDELIDAVEEFRLEDVAHFAEHSLLGRVLRLLLLVAGADGEAEGRRALLQEVCTGVTRHDDDGVAEVDGASLAVRQAAVVEHLQQDVEDVGMRLLDFVEQDDGVRLAAHGVRELAALLVADVARGRADHARDGVLLHVLRHVEADDGVLRAEERL